MYNTHIFILGKWQVLCKEIWYCLISVESGRYQYTSLTGLILPLPVQSQTCLCLYLDFKHHIYIVVFLCLFNSLKCSDFLKLAEKLSVIRTDRHENLVRPKNIFPVWKKSPKEFTVTCMIFSLAFLEWFTLVLAIGHLISPLVFIEVKVIQFSVFSVVQNYICYVFYSVYLEFCCFDDLVL
jgi:hypothetical protein